MRNVRVVPSSSTGLASLACVARRHFRPLGFQRQFVYHALEGSQVILLCRNALRIWGLNIGRHNGRPAVSEAVIMLHISSRSALHILPFLCSGMDRIGRTPFLEPRFVGGLLASFAAFSASAFFLSGIVLFLQVLTVVMSGGRSGS